MKIVKGWDVTYFIARCAILTIVFKNYFKWAKYGSFLLNCTKCSWFYFVGSLEYWHCESIFKYNLYCKSGKQKENYIYLVNEETGAVTVTFDSQ